MIKTHSESGRYKSALLLLAAIGVIWFALLGYRDLLQPDEGRYAEIPREMVATGDWLTPRLNGFKYFEKPAAQYWLTAVGYTLFGESNTTARLWPALLGFLTLPWVMWLGTRLFNRATGLYAGLILTSTFLWVALGHTLTLDMGVSAFMSFGIGALLIAQSRREHDPDAVRNWMLFGWSMLAVATLWKGLMGIVLPGAVVFLYSVWMRDFRWWRHLHLGKGLALFLLITAPWFIAVSLANPSFAKFFFLHEHLERFAEKTYHYGEPWWYFIPLLFVAGLPWVANIFMALLRPGFRSQYGQGPRWWVAHDAAHAPAFDPVRFLWVYVVFIVAFFSLSHSKLLTYLLPVYPALALLAGQRLGATATHGLHAQPRFRFDTLVSALFGLLMLGLAFNLHHFTSSRMPLSVVEQTRPWVLATMAVFLIGAAVSAWFRFRGPRAAVALSLAALLGFQCIGWGYQGLASMYSAHGLARLIKPILANPNGSAPALAQTRVPVYSLGRYDQSLPFYLNRTVHLGLYKGELAYGIKRDPHNYIATLAEFRRQWAPPTQAVAVLAPDVFKTLELDAVPMHVIHQDLRRVVVTRLPTRHATHPSASPPVKDRVQQP